MEKANFLKEIDLRKLCETLFPSIILNGAGLISCPFHPDRKPSLSFYSGSDDKPRFHCFGCGASGDAIDLVQAAARLNGEELNFPEALTRLGEVTEILIDTSFSEAYQAKRIHQECLGKVTNYFQVCLQDHTVGRQARDWLIERGIPRETWSRLSIGVYPPWEELRDWAKTQGIQRDWLKKEKLLVGANGGGQKWTGSLAFFYGLSFREASRIKLRIPRTKEMIILGEKERDIGIFGLTSYDPRKGDGGVLLVEGEFDLLIPWALAIQEKNLVPSIFCRSGGAAIGNRIFKILAGLGVPTLYALPDNDQAGREWVEKIIKGASSAGLGVLVSWPTDYRPGEDPADLARRLPTWEPFQQAVTSNILLPYRWIARKILSEADDSSEGIVEARQKALTYAKKLKGTPRGDFLAEVAPAVNAQVQDLLDELQEDKPAGNGLDLDTARGVLEDLQKSEHIKAALESPETLGALALVAGRDRGTYEAKLLQLCEAGVQGKVVEALKRAVNAERRKRTRTLRLVHPGDEPESVHIRDLLPETPVPKALVAPRGWRISENGLAREIIAEEGEGTSLVRAAPSPILIAGRLKDISEGTESTSLVWMRDGHWQHCIAERSVVANSRDLVSLAGVSLPVTSGTAKALVEYLADFEAENLEHLPRAHVSRQIGWQGNRGERGFLWGRMLIRPDGSLTKPIDLETMAPDSWQEDWITFRGADAGDEQIASGFCSAGSFAEWKLAAYLVSSYPRVILSFYAALAPPFLVVLDAPNFIVDWSFATSTGKTTTLRLAASCWGNPDERKHAAVMGSWDATRVWIERAAGVLNSLPLILDDTKRARRPQDVAQVLYDVASGRGRGRGSPKGMRQSGSWRTVLLSSGEAPADSFTQDGGTRGRIVKIWGPPFGRADDTTVSVVRELNLAIRQHYGHAGPRFVQFLLKNRERWNEWKREFFAVQKGYSEQAGSNPIADRLVEYFAVLTIAAQIAHVALDLPWKYSNPIAPLWEDLMKEASEADRATKALEYVLSWAQGHQSEFFGRHRLDHDGTPLQPLPGWAGRWDEEEGWKSIAFLPHKLRAVLMEAGFEPEAIIRIWHERGWLLTDGNQNRTQKLIRMDGERAWCVVVSQSAFEQPEGRQDSDDVMT